MDRAFLKELLATPSVSGYEEAIQAKALAFGRGFAGAQLTDPSGNAISVVNPQAGHKILLCGHIDEIGFVVTHIDGDGRLHLTAAGGVRPKLYIGSPVQVWHEGQPVNGVIATSSALLKKEKVEDRDLLVDIGVCCREEAEKAVAVGDPVCADAAPREMLGGCFSGRALDDRTGAFVVLEAAKKAAEMGAGMGIYAATTVGEETSGRGAYYAAARVQPACAIAVDVTWASDAPGTDPGDTGEVKLGGGPVLCRASVVNKRMNALLQAAAAELGIPLQWEIATGRTGTDGDTVNKAGLGIPMALVSIPLRYMHSSVEMGCWKDLEGCIDLLAGFLVRLSAKMEEGFDFCTVQV
ncbi:M20/M25/M40 family metallo-hydrolase [Acutalibacter caecimuris]|uniref:M20/M25/M40 family metallo-hydrolase n=1 Tax=Acutalibacter caecimuris TaxID=3093657 RepID=UPI002AC94F91|nr:M20/M25/M40 family metallo-hydrolase [Acutalibacter sp. M00118]